MIATGHAPHTDFEKNLDFGQSPFGVTGLETALPAIYTQLIKPGKLNWAQLVQAMSHAPRKLLKMNPPFLTEGSFFEAFLFDTQGKTPITRETLCSKSYNSPWLGETLEGNIEQMFIGGVKIL
ncbi:MAG: hypothetical protein AAFZ92_06275 [Pseudomonadota bacterium]